ncbi:pyruvate decarboxylase [Cylindrobasidium torrendii FP15055 ss-10]|uniref:Pyruvate decarboxylase n=1 Tax=Cylindrobasidium torrendii FP15055 ss-10 TaxID=1314674 RepID=A0A0D7BUF0_9AGAR|nr:pyruvate decarboxylase [Cylindrobasidium torrendii FP15055 ss-10]
MLQSEINRLKLEVQTLQGESGNQPIYIGQYLIERLKQLGVTTMFGVPGDFNLGFLDLVEDDPVLDWAGNCNELNAAYAADGYARVKEHSLGVLLTTFGVGELSAVNGIAGAFSEMVPVLHIAGVPSTHQQKAKPMLHHTLGDGRYNAYELAAEQFACATANLVTVETAASEIDRVLTECISQARPVYLTLPTDIAYQKISSERLKVPLSALPLPNDPEVEAFVVDEISKLVEAAKGDVVILVDACCVRHDAREETLELINATGFPVYAAPMGKTAVSEDHERYGGLYVGSISRPEIKEKVESAKLIISIGGLKSDFNSGNFTYSIPRANTVELHSSWTMVQYADFPRIGMKELIPKLAKSLAHWKPTALQISVPKFSAIVPQDNEPAITHSYFWPRMSQFFKPKDVIVAETGTSSFGILDVPLPAESILVTQILWGSIGYTTGATLGAALAARDRQLGRTILFIGDGSIQLTVQELCTIMRKDLKPIIFLLNNTGYTIERYLHGKTRKYNDIVNWKWTSLLSVLGDEDGTKSQSYTVNDRTELSNLLDTPEFARADKCQLVEVMMPMHDAPRALEVQAELSGKTNKYTS